MPPRDRQMAFSYNLGAWFFRTGDYRAATPLLRGIDFQDVSTNIGARQMLVRMFYESNDFEALSATLDSFQTYLNRHKDFGYTIENYSNFIKIVRKMLRNPPKKGGDNAVLKTDIAQTAALAERDWLLLQL